jgi:hypothetical protein
MPFRDFRLAASALALPQSIPSEELSGEHREASHHHLLARGQTREERESVELSSKREKRCGAASLFA